MSIDAPVFIGIDVSKEWVDVAVRPTAGHLASQSCQEGIGALILQFQSLDPQCVVMEATGGYEMPLSIALGAVGIPVAVVNPRQVRDLPAIGKLAVRADRSDAAMGVCHKMTKGLQGCEVPGSARFRPLRATTVSADVTRRRNGV